MIAYTTLGSNDLSRASAFYDTLLASLGAKRLMDLGRIVLWGTGPGAPMFAVCTPYDGKTAVPGNGTMVSLGVPDAEAVQRVHKLALELGAADEGAPGERMPGVYIGYFRDLDGNKLALYVTGKA